MSTPRLLVTCEHATHAVPPRWRAALSGARAVLRTHRGWDPGALAFAQALARRFDAPLLVGQVTRLLVDLNRSPHNPRRFSPWSAALPASDRARLDAEIHAPHFARVLACCRGRTRVVHVAVHSFDPTLAADRDGLDVGLLYDPRRERERAVATAWASGLVARGLVTRKNFPYRGASDGLSTWLRKRLPPDRYVGVELELSQAWSIDAKLRRARIDPIAQALAAAITSGGSRAGSRRR